MKIEFILNLCSSRGKKAGLASRIRDKFFGHEYRITNSAYAGHARKLTEQAVNRGCDALVAVGGDGTVHEIVNGSRGSNIPIGIIPLGAANDLAARLNIPANFEDACDVVLSGRVRRVDAMLVNDRYMLTVCGTGFPAAVIAAVISVFNRTTLSRLIKSWLQYRIYLIGVAIAFLKDLPQTTIGICCDGKWQEISSLSLIIGLQPNLGTCFTALPHLDPNGISMAGYSIETGSRLRLLRHVMRTARGVQQNLRDTLFFHGRHIVLEMPTATPLFGDGELLEADNRFEITRIPQAIPFFVPVAVRNRP